MWKGALVGVFIALGVGLLGVAPLVGFVLIAIAVVVWIMLNGHRSKTERLLLKLERTMLAMIAAAKADDLAALHDHGRQQLGILHELNMSGECPEERMNEFLTSRGLLSRFNDAEFGDFLRHKMQQAEMRFGLLGG